MTTKQIEATQKVLATIGCDTDAVYYCNPRGFSNEWSLLPIPTQFRAEAAQLVEDYDGAEGGTVLMLAIADINETQMLQIWGWGNQIDANALLTDEWAQAIGLHIPQE